jgi:hypothetical protein
MASNATNTLTSIKIFVKVPEGRSSVDQFTSLMVNMGVKACFGRPFIGQNENGEFTTVKGCVFVKDERKKISQIAFSDFVENISRKSTDGFRVEHSGMVFYIVPDKSTGIHWKLQHPKKSSSEECAEEPTKVINSISFGKHPIKIFVGISHLSREDRPTTVEITNAIEYHESELIFCRNEFRNGDIITFDVNKKLGFEPGSPEWLDFAPFVQGFVESVKHARNGVRDKSRLFQLMNNVWVDFMFINTIQPWMNHFLKVKRDVQDVDQDGKVVWKTIYVNPDEQLPTPPPTPHETPKKTWNFPALPSKTYKVNGRVFKSESDARIAHDVLTEAGIACAIECAED